jgi:transposase
MMTATARLWVYMRDDRPAGQATPPAVWFAYSPNRKGEHPKQHLTSFTRTLQADRYAGYDQLYLFRPIQEAACWAHVRRKYWDGRITCLPVQIRAANALLPSTA